jgi:hypothetical protein
MIREGELCLRTESGSETSGEAGVDGDVGVDVGAGEFVEGREDGVCGDAADAVDEDCELAGD